MVKETVRKRMRMKNRNKDEEITCPRCNKTYKPESLGELYVCKFCGCYMPRYEEEDEYES